MGGSYGSHVYVPVLMYRILYINTGTYNNGVCLKNCNA